MDVQNMFNTLCRVAMMEDLMGSEELLGVDFSEHFCYVDWAYSKDSSLWFRIEESIEAEATAGQQTRWAEVKSCLGVHQGRPLSCFLAAVGLVKCALAAQSALDKFDAVERHLPCRNP